MMPRDGTRMDVRGKRLIVIGGAGFIGSHIVDELTREDVGEIVVYDNFARGTAENLHDALKDPRVKVYEVGDEFCQTDILNAALEGADGSSTSPRSGSCTAAT